MIEIILRVPAGFALKDIPEQAQADIKGKLALIPNSEIMPGAAKVHQGKVLVHMILRDGIDGGTDAEILQSIEGFVDSMPGPWALVGAKTVRATTAATYDEDGNELTPPLSTEYLWLDDAVVANHLDDWHDGDGNVIPRPAGTYKLHEYHVRDRVPWMVTV